MISLAICDHWRSRQVRENICMIKIHRQLPP
jgi:hypothetical protein